MCHFVAILILISIQSFYSVVLLRLVGRGCSERQNAEIESEAADTEETSQRSRETGCLHTT